MAGFADATKYGIETDSGELRGNMITLPVRRGLLQLVKLCRSILSLRTIMAISKWLGIFW